MRRINFNIVVFISSAIAMCGFCFGAQAQTVNKQVFIGDRVIAVIGDRMILQSDLDMAEAYMKEQNKIPFTEMFSEEQIGVMLNQMMTQKLLSAQAVLDSLVLPEVQVIAQARERVNALVEQYGSIKNAEEARRKQLYLVEEDIKDQLREQMLSQLMTQTVQSKTVVTPAEVKDIVNSINKDSLPIIPEQYEYYQIILKAPSNEKTRGSVTEQLLALRSRVMKGDNFAALATLYSDDTESAKRGGEMIVTPQMVVSPFADAMVSLTEGQVSNIVETEFGFHIIQLISKDGDKYRVRHILLRNKFSYEDIAKSITRLDSIKKEINDGKLTFADAAKNFSDDTETKDTGGLAINSENANNYQSAGMKSNKFFIDELKGDYAALSSLKEGEVSEPFETYDNSGNKICKVVKLKHRTSEHIADIKNDYSLLVNYALNIKREKAFATWLKLQKEKMYVRIESPYDNYPLIVKEWSK